MVINVGGAKELELDLLNRLLKGGSSIYLKEQDFILISKALYEKICFNIDQVIEFLSSDEKTPFYYIITTNETIEIIYICYIPERKVLSFRLSTNNESIFPTLPKQVPTPTSTELYISSSMSKLRLVALYCIAKSLSTTILESPPDTSNDFTLFIFSELVKRGMSITTRSNPTPEKTLPFQYNNLIDAISTLNVNIPDWLRGLWLRGDTKGDTTDAIDNLSRCFLQVLSSQLVVIEWSDDDDDVDDDGTNNSNLKIVWTNQRNALLLLARWNSRYSAILKLEVDTSNGKLKLSSPNIKCIENYVIYSDETNYSLLNFKSIRFNIENRVVSIINAIRCKFCDYVIQELSTIDQENHIQDCKTKQLKQQEDVFTSIDRYLASGSLKRNQVSFDDGYCLIRVLLLSNNKEVTRENVLKLLDTIWRSAKERDFDSASLNDSHRRLLKSITIDSAEDLLFRGHSFASDNFPVIVFWDLVCLWAAHIIQKDIYIISYQSKTCTLISRDLHVPVHEVPFTEVSSRLDCTPSIALIYMKLPSLHIEWVSMMKGDLMRCNDGVNGDVVASPPAVPFVPLTPSPASHEVTVEIEVPTPADVIMPDVVNNYSATPSSQLSALLEGSTVQLSLTSHSPHWWQSWDGVFEKCRKSTGSIVWYSRTSTTSNIWQQHPVGILPTKCGLSNPCSLEKWFSWHENAKKLPCDAIMDLFYLIDVHLDEKHFDDIIASLPLIGLLDDRKSPYSIHYYLRKVCQNIDYPNLGPNLYFAPAIIQGAISTPLHLDGLGHMMSYHWFISGELDSLNLVDIYSSEEKLGHEKWRLFRSIAGGAMSSLSGLKLPHSIDHSSNSLVQHGCDEFEELSKKSILPERTIQLKPGEILLLPAGHPHAFKKWPQIDGSKTPLVSIAGDIAWIGSTKKEATESIERMINVEKRLSEAYCLPELSMIACLMTYEPSSDLHREHLYAFVDRLRVIINSEVNAFKLLPSTIPCNHVDASSNPLLWECKSCKNLILNSVLWTTDNDDTFCIYCYETTNNSSRSPSSKRTRSLVDVEISFRFAHPLALLEKLNHLLAGISEVPSKEGMVGSPSMPRLHVPCIDIPSSCPPPAPLAPQHSTLSTSLHAHPLITSATPTQLFDLISEYIVLHRTVDQKHEICEKAHSLEKDPTLPKNKKELLLRLNNDLVKFCHTKDENDCPLLKTSSEREQLYIQHRQQYRCRKCKKNATWDRPLYNCPGLAHERETTQYTFHLDCAGYKDTSNVPIESKLLCKQCLSEKRGDRLLINYQNLHLWESTKARAELYKQGFHIIEIPRDGLCFLTALKMMSERCVCVALR